MYSCRGQFASTGSMTPMHRSAQQPRVLFPGQGPNDAEQFNESTLSDSSLSLTVSPESS